MGGGAVAGTVGVVFHNGSNDRLIGVLLSTENGLIGIEALPIAAPSGTMLSLGSER